MAVDYGAKEREFIASLAEDTGQDLAAWMAAIDAAGLGHRNDIIDWLRRQGFLFAKASWLERIHHNGGRPIYGEAAPARPGAALRRVMHREGAAPRLEPATSSPAEPAPRQAPQPRAEPPAAGEPLPPFETRPPAPGPLPPPAPPSEGSDGPLADVLATAKAYRPLAQFALREIERACPGTVASVRDGYIVLSAPAEFAVLTLSPREIRLGLDLGGWPYVAPMQKAKLSGPPARYGHMVVLTDARQVDSALLANVRAARDRNNR